MALVHLGSFSVELKYKFLEENHKTCCLSKNDTLLDMTNSSRKYFLSKYGQAIGVTGATDFCAADTNNR